MKKLSYLLIAFVAIAIVGCKPEPEPELTLSLEWNGEAYAADTLVLVDPELEYGEMVCHMLVRNNAETDANVMLRKDVITAVDSSQNYFCWGECYLPSVEVSLSSVTIAANGTSGIEQFAGHYMPGPNSGATDIKYTFYVEGNETNKVSFTARYEYTQGE